MSFLRKLGFGNRRQEVRINISPPLKCVCTSSLAQQEGLLGFMTDISKNSALISVNQHGFLVGGDIEVRPQICSSGSPVVLHGTVVRSRRGAQNWCALAIKFDKKNEIDVKYLLDRIIKRT